MPDVFSKAKRSAVMSRIRGRGNKDTELALMLDPGNIEALVLQALVDTLKANIFATGDQASHSVSHATSPGSGNATGVRRQAQPRRAVSGRSKTSRR